MKQPKNLLRIVIDTNLWISYLLNKSYIKLDFIVHHPSVRLLIDENLLAELLDVTQRTKFQKYFTEEDSREMIAMILPKSEFIDTRTVVNICRDPKDDYLLALAKDGEADYIITGDKDLLVLKQFEKTRIITLSDFVSQLG